MRAGRARPAARLTVVFVMVARVVVRKAGAGWSQMQRGVSPFGGRSANQSCCCCLQRAEKSENISLSEKMTLRRQLAPRRLRSPTAIRSSQRNLPRAGLLPVPVPVPPPPPLLKALSSPPDAPFSSAQTETQTETPTPRASSSAKMMKMTMMMRLVWMALVALDALNDGQRAGGGSC